MLSVGDVEIGLSREKQRLLLNAARYNGGLVTARMAMDLYSSKSAGKSALQSLAVEGYVSYLRPGVFEIEKLPGVVRRRLDGDGCGGEEPG